MGVIGTSSNEKLARGRKFCIKSMLFMAKSLVKPEEVIAPRAARTGKGNHRKQTMKTEVAVLLAAMTTANLFAQSFKVLHTFTNSPDGATPSGGLVLRGSSLYGMTRQGGNSGDGTVFRVNMDGTGFVIPMNFSGSDGKNPNGGLVLSGNTLYGTASGGGDSSNGVVFELVDLGQWFSSYTIKSFTTNDGKSLNGGLALGGSTLYGTTYGYPPLVAPPGGDVVFKLQTDGTGFSVLSNLTGMNPLGGMRLNGSTLYGTTINGGAGAGTVFKISTNGTGYSVVKSFTGSDGSSPNGSLALNADTLYGTTESGGDFGQGTVFKVNTNGSGFVTLKSFPALVHGTNTDGAAPIGGLLLSGNTLFGATYGGGSAGKGVLFKINTDGSGFAVLKSFPVAPYWSGVYTNSDGANPNGDLLLNCGTLYGTTAIGGSAGKGVLFRLVVPPEIQINDASFGVRTNCFGFNVIGVSNQSVVIEACTNLVTTNWVPVRYKTLDAKPYYFSDAQWANYYNCFYRVRVQ